MSQMGPATYWRHCTLCPNVQELVELFPRGRTVQCRSKQSPNHGNVYKGNPSTMVALAPSVVDSIVRARSINKILKSCDGDDYVLSSQHKSNDNQWQFDK
jgi:hypothetical protein